MATNLPPDVVLTILSAFVYRDEGASEAEIAAAFPEPPPRGTVHDWVTTLVADGFVTVDKRAKPYRYLTTTPGGEYYRCRAAAPSTPVADRAPAVQDVPAGRDPGAGLNAGGNGPAIPAATTTPAAGSGAAAGAAGDLAGETAAAVPAGLAGDLAGVRDPGPGLHEVGANRVPPAATVDGPRDAQVDGAGDVGGAGNPTDFAGNHAGNAGKTAGTFAGTPAATISSSDAAGSAAAVAGAVAGAVNEAGAADADGFKPAFDALVFPIVAGVMPRASALALLQTWPADTLADPARRGRFVDYGLDRLSHLTLGDCTRVGLHPGQFELWRRQYFAAAHPPSTAPSAAEATADAGIAGSAFENRDSKIENPTSPQSAVRTPQSAGAAQPSTLSSPDLVTAVLTPLLTAVLPAISPPSPSAPANGHATASSPSMTASAGGVSSNPAASRAANAAANTTAKGLVTWLSGQTGGLPPAVSGLLLLIATTLVGWLLSLISGNPMVAVIIAVALFAVVAVRILIVRRRASAAVAPFDGAGTVGSAIENRDSKIENPTPPQSAVRTPQFPSSGLPRSAFRISSFLLLTVAVIAGVVWYRHTQRPPESALREYLVGSVAPLPVRVVALTPTYGPASAIGCPVTYQVRFATTEPLYRRINLTDYLRAHAPDLLRDAQPDQGPTGQGDQGPGTRDQGLSTPQSAVRTPQFPAASAGAASNLKSQISNFKSGADAPVLVTTQTPPGATALGSGSLTAWRNNGVWMFTPSAATLDRTSLAGERKPAGALDVDFPGDLARLNAWVADQVALAAKAKAEATAAAAEQERHRQQQVAAFGQLLRPGTLFTGTIVDPMRGTNQRIVVELTAATNQQLFALLRNDGGWSDARRFAGEWMLTPAADAAIVTLRTSRADYVNGAGPLLQDRLDWSLALQVRADGGAVAAAGGSTLNSQPSTLNFGAAATLRRIDPAAAPAAKADILRPLTAAVAATAPGLVYRGTVTSNTYGTTESLLLRFVPVAGAENADPTQVMLRATLESATVAARVRPFNGTLVSSTYRVGDLPIRLQSDDSARVAAAGVRSLLGFDSTNNSLVLALRADGDRLVGQGNGFTYTFAPDSGANVDQRPGTKDQGPTGQGDQGPGTKDQGPQPAGASNPASTPPSNPASNAAQPADAADLKSQISNLKSLPPFPAAAGAYVLSDDAWVALPTNNGKAYQGIAQKALTKLLELHYLEDAAAGQVNPPPKDVVGEVAFDGRDRVPVVSGQGVVLVYVGALALPKPAAVKRYPPLGDYPLLEVARLQVDVDKAMRFAPLYLVGPGSLGIGADRVEATVEQPKPGVTVLRCQRALGAGRFALCGAAKPYELEAK